MPGCKLFKINTLKSIHHTAAVRFRYIYRTIVTTLARFIPLGMGSVPRRRSIGIGSAPAAATQGSPSGRMIHTASRRLVIQRERSFPVWTRLHISGPENALSDRPGSSTRGEPESCSLEGPGSSTRGGLHPKTFSGHRTGPRAHNCARTQRGPAARQSITHIFIHVFSSWMQGPEKLHKPGRAHATAVPNGNPPALTAISSFYTH